MRHAMAFAAAAILGTGTAAFAQTQTMPSQLQAPQSNAAGADQVICEKHEDTGSRLSAHKICHTRSQWDQLRRDDRSAIEHVQQQRTMGH